MKIPAIYTEIIVCYDVADNKQRKKLYDSLCDIGLISIQKSVFWGYATMAERKSIFGLFELYLNKETDRAFVLPAAVRNRILGLEGFGYTESNLPEWTEYGCI